MTRLAAPILAALAAAAPAAAQAPRPAQDWQPLGEPGFLSFSWDRASVVRRGDVVEVVVRVKAAIVSPGPGHADFLTEFSCPDRKTRVTRTTNYGRNGAPIVDNSRNRKFRRIKPGTDDDRLYGILCRPQGG